MSVKRLYRETCAIAALLGCAVLIFAACDTSTRRVPAALKPGDMAVLSDAIITRENPGQLRLTFDAAVDVAAGDVSGFTPEGSASARSAVSLISGSGTKTLVLLLDGNATAGETIKLSYNFVTGEEKLTTNSNGKRVESVSGFPVTNLAPDTIPPTLAGAAIVTDAGLTAFKELDLVFSERMAAPAAAYGSALGFSLVSGGGAPAFADAAFRLSGDKFTLTLTLAAPAAEGQSIWLNYDGGTVKDLAGNPLGPIANYPVENPHPAWYHITLDWNNVPVAAGFAGPARPDGMWPTINSPVTLPRAADYGTVKTGYTHTGWRDSQGTTTPLASGGNPTPYTASGHVTLTAVWEADSYNISYDIGSEGVSNHLSNLPAYTIEDTVPLYAPAGSNGATFLGWYGYSDFSGPAVASIPAGTTGAKSFYAKWQPLTYNLILSPGAGGDLAATVGGLPIAANGSPIAVQPGQTVEFTITPGAAKTGRPVLTKTAGGAADIGLTPGTAAAPVPQPYYLYDETGAPIDISAYTGGVVEKSLARINGMGAAPSTYTFAMPAYDITLASQFAAGLVGRSFEIRLDGDEAVSPQTLGGGNLPNIKGTSASPVSITVQSRDGTTQRTLYLSALGSMFNLEADAYITLAVGSVKLFGWMSSSADQKLSYKFFSAPQGNPQNTSRGDNTESLVSVAAGSRFVMNAGGAIFGNSASDGGGVHVMDGAFVMNAGSSISWNCAASGGGVFISGASATFDMFGGTITANFGDGYGGGVMLTYGALFTMSGANALISGNYADNRGGGLSCENSYFTMEAGEISGNGCGIISYSPYYYNFFAQNGGTYKWPRGTHGMVTGTDGVNNDFELTSNTECVWTISSPGLTSILEGEWYSHQAQGMVIKAEKLMSAP